MLEILYYVATSLDGCIATFDGDVSWLDAYDPPKGEDYGFNEMYASIDSVIMGSRTWEFALAHGGEAELPTWVFTHRDLPRRGRAVLTSDDPAAVVSAMSEQGLKRTWFMGGGVLAASFLELDLITHFSIAIIPIVLGGGAPLFAAAARPSTLKLTGSRAYENGVVLLTYERGGEAAA